MELGQHGSHSWEGLQGRVDLVEGVVAVDLGVFWRPCNLYTTRQVRCPIITGVSPQHPEQTPTQRACTQTGTSAHTCCPSGSPSCESLNYPLKLVRTQVKTSSLRCDNLTTPLHSPLGSHTREGVAAPVPPTPRREPLLPGTREARPAVHAASYCREKKKGPERSSEAKRVPPPVIPVQNPSCAPLARSVGCRTPSKARSLA